MPIPAAAPQESDKGIVMHWLLRMSRWARNPPSARRVMLAFAVIITCLAIYAVERWIGWPNALTAERLRWSGPR